MSKIRPVPQTVRDDRDMAGFLEEVRERTDSAETGKLGTVLQSTSVTDLNQTIAGPSIAEVQAISDKVDELLAALRTAGTVET